MKYHILWMVLIMTATAWGQSPADAANASTPIKSVTSSPEAIVLQKLLTEGKISSGIGYIGKKLADDPQNDRLKYALGLLQFTRAVEELSQSWYKYGLRPAPEFAQDVPFMRLPVPVNPAPEEVSDAAIRAVLQQFLNNLALCEKSLSDMKDESVSMPIPFVRIRLDLDGDGQASDSEMLLNIYIRIFGVDAPADGADVLIEFDAADAYWLRGYCHILGGFIEFWLAHDSSQLFNTTAHLFFEKPQPAHEFLMEERVLMNRRGSFPRRYLDAIALAYGMARLPLREPARMQAALTHLQQVTTMSRESWRCCLAETDNDNEWIPNPNQTSVIPDATISAEMISQWMIMLDEIDAVLKGDKLIPFWRGAQPRGVNIAKVFLEPADFDLLLWIQGTAAEPYLAYGPLTDAAFWTQIMASFNGRFIPYAIWFN